jgi:hypothetical protein
LTVGSSSVGRTLIFYIFFADLIGRVLLSS